MRIGLYGVREGAEDPSLHGLPSGSITTNGCESERGERGFLFPSGRVAACPFPRDQAPAEPVAPKVGTTAVGVMFSESAPFPSPATDESPVDHSNPIVPAIDWNRF